MNAQLAGKDLGEYFQMAMSSAYLSKNWIMIVTPIIAAIAIYACKKWSFYVYMLAITTLFVFSYVGFQSKNGDLGMTALIAVYLINITVVVYFLIPAVRNIYFDRRMRWWEVKPRYNCNFSAKWNFEDNDVIHEGEVGNISVNGLFLKSEIYPRDEDMVEIEIPFDNGKDVKFSGKVVFHSTAGKIGFGVQFNHDKLSKQAATEITNDLDAKGMKAPGIQLRPEDSLTFWLRTLVTTGKGLIPKSK